MITAGRGQQHVADDRTRCQLLCMAVAPLVGLYTTATRIAGCAQQILNKTAESRATT